MANPYPSNIDWDLSNIPANTNSAIYIWDPANNRYTSYSKGAGTGTNGGTQYIPPAQGFFIETQNALAAGTETFTFTDGLRNTSTTATFFKNGKPNPELYIEVMNNTTKVKDQTFIQFTDVSTELYDGNFDAKKFFNGTGVPSLYTIIDELYSINCLPTFDSAYSIALGFKCESTTEQSYTISLADLNKMDGWQTIIEDKLLQTKKVMNLGTYTFTHKGALPVEDRFVIHFVKPANDPNSVALPINTASDFKVYQDYTTVYYDLGSIQTERLKVEFYDLGGKKLLTQDLNISGSHGTIEIPSSFSNSTLILKVINGQETRTLKIIR